MSLLFSSFSANLPAHRFRLRPNSRPNPSFFCVNLNTFKDFISCNKNFGPLVKKKLSNIARESINSTYGSISFDFGDNDGEIDDLESSWEGAVIYHRNASISHIEYCTTLERLGLGELSTETSKSRASVMGLRVTKVVKDFPQGTPVLISADVTRKKKRLRLDGIVRTVITLACNRCGGPTAESIFSNFSLLLTEEPIEEPDVINLGVIYGEDKQKTYGSEEEDDDEASIDLDDWLYFPPEEKTIDISKNIRDMLHVEITLNSVCDPMCKGMCLYCGSNLNISSCKCDKDESPEKKLGPLRGLKKQMQKN